MMSEETGSEKPPCVWSSDIETVVKNIQSSCNKRKIVHMEMAIEYQNKFSSLMMTNIVLGPLAGLLSTITLTVDSINTEITIIASCLGFVAGTIAAITKFGKYDESSATHKGASVKFSALEANIKRQLALPTNARSPPDKYLTFIDNSYEGIVSSAPLASVVIDDHEEHAPAELKISMTDESPEDSNCDPTKLKPDPRLEYELDRMFKRG